MRYVNMKLPVLAQASSTAFRLRIRHDLNSPLRCMPTRPIARKFLAQPLRLTLTKIRVLSPDLGMNYPKIKKKSVIDAAPHNILSVTALSLSQSATTATKTAIDWINVGSSTGNPSTSYPVPAQTDGHKETPIETSPSSEVTRTINVSSTLPLGLSMVN